MTDIFFSPSISFISLLFQVCWLIRSCMIRSGSNTWLDSLSLISFLLDSGYSLYSRSQVLPVSHTSIRGTTGDWWEPVSSRERDRMLLISLLSSAKLTMTSRRICGTSSISSSSSLSSTTSSATFSSSEAGTVTMGVFPLTRGVRFSWINFIFIQLNICNVGGVAHYDRNPVHLLLCSSSSKVPSVCCMFAVCRTGPRTIVADGRVYSSKVRAVLICGIQLYSRDCSLSLRTIWDTTLIIPLDKRKDHSFSEFIRFSCFLENYGNKRYFFSCLLIYFCLPLGPDSSLLGFIFLFTLKLVVQDWYF